MPDDFAATSQLERGYQGYGEMQLPDPTAVHPLGCRGPEVLSRHAVELLVEQTMDRASDGVAGHGSRGMDSIPLPEAREDNRPRARRIWNRTPTIVGGANPATGMARPLGTRVQRSAMPV